MALPTARFNTFLNHLRVYHLFLLKIKYQQIIYLHHYLHLHNLHLFWHKIYDIHHKIHQRQKEIIGDQLIEEVQRLLTKYNPKADHPVCKAINYRHIR